jgi:hypothetical protein
LLGREGVLGVVEADGAAQCVEGILESAEEDLEVLIGGRRSFDRRRN